MGLICHQFWLKLQHQKILMTNPFTGNLRSFVSARNKLIDLLSSNLEKRFKTNERVLKATIISRLTSYPKQLTDELEFGNKHIDVLKVEFGMALSAAGVEPGNLTSSWLRFKLLLYHTFDSVSQKTWGQIHSKLSAECPDILTLVELLLAQPCSLCDAECGFSEMKMVKTDWRNSLHEEHLSDLMTVSLETPNIREYGPRGAINLWSSSAIRRPQQSLALLSWSAHYPDKTRPFQEDVAETFENDIQDELEEIEAYAQLLETMKDQ